jgi:hypothetical protein
MSKIPRGITRQDVLDALASLDRGDPHLFGESTGYDLVEGGKHYAPKAVLGLAARRVAGHPLGPYDFHGGDKSECFRVLRGLGFVIVTKQGVVNPGDDWTEEEIRAVVQDYFAMLRMDRSGVPYNKAEHNRALQQRLPGRSKGSIEYKYQNVSGVLYEEQFPYIPGYKPARNYQRRILPDIVLEYLGAGEDDVTEIVRALDDVAVLQPESINYGNCEFPPPERDPELAVNTPPSRPRRARKFDQASKDAANRKLGRAGEEFVVGRERWYLRSRGRADLAEKVEWASDTRGDGLGYDILSFDPATGAEIYIEVKTTNCGPDFPFYASQAEVDASIELGPRYRLYRVSNFSTAPQFYIVAGDLNQGFTLRARAYEVRRM